LKVKNKKNIPLTPFKGGVRDERKKSVRWDEI
jgi:hypothetical protein